MRLRALKVRQSLVWLSNNYLQCGLSGLHVEIQQLLCAFACHLYQVLNFTQVCRQKVVSAPCTLCVAEGGVRGNGVQQ